MSIVLQSQLTRRELRNINVIVSVRPVRPHMSEYVRVLFEKGTKVITTPKIPRRLLRSIKSAWTNQGWMFHSTEDC